MSAVTHVFDPEFKYIYDVPSYAVVHLPPARLNITRLVWCRNYRPNEPGSCALGNNCKFVHANCDCSMLVSHPIHVNYIWRSAELCIYERLPAGETLEVALPGRQHVTDRIPSEHILVTAAVTNLQEEQRNNLFHCVHFYCSRMCTRGADCNFIHVLYINPNVKADFKRAPSRSLPADTSAMESRWGKLRQTASQSPGLTEIIPTSGSHNTVSLYSIGVHHPMPNFLSTTESTTNMESLTSTQNMSGSLSLHVPHYAYGPSEKVQMPSAAIAPTRWGSAANTPTASIINTSEVSAEHAKGFTNGCGMPPYRAYDGHLAAPHVGGDRGMESAKSSQTGNFANDHLTSPFSGLTPTSTTLSQSLPYPRSDMNTAVPTRMRSSGTSILRAAKVIRIPQCVLRGASTHRSGMSGGLDGCYESSQTSFPTCSQKKKHSASYDCTPSNSIVPSAVASAGQRRRTVGSRSLRTSLYYRNDPYVSSGSSSVVLLTQP